MRVLEIAGICVIALLALLFALVLRRRLLMGVGGSIRLHVRLNTMVHGRGWSAGVGRFAGDELRFHRLFTFSVRPKCVFNRHSMTVTGRRLPAGPENLAMPGNWIILACMSGDSAVEIAMAESTVTGFSSWLEAGPPGSSADWRRSAPRRSPL